MNYFMGMENPPTRLYNVGLSYKKADVKVRSAFSVSKTQQRLLLEDAKRKGIEGLFILSTCNRTEITGFAKHPFELISLLVKYSEGTVEEFITVSNVYKDKAAVRHLFNIGTGLESQILGDYEIVGQLKQSFKLAKEVGTTNAYLERMMNLILQASKEVKNTTKLSSGTTSVAYAATQYIIDEVPSHSEKNILVYGLGEIGKNACKNLLEYTDCENITLINRTQEKALRFRQDHPVIQVKEATCLEAAIEKASILIVSTGAEKPTVLKQHFQAEKEILILDLSMPENVSMEVLDHKGVQLINLDELSKITDKTIAARKDEIPKVVAIIDAYKAEFNQWVTNRKYVPAVNALKESLLEMQQHELKFHCKKIKDFNLDHAEEITSRMIQKITTKFVKHLQEEDTTVDQSISVMNSIFSSEKISL